VDTNGPGVRVANGIWAWRSEVGHTHETVLSTHGVIALHSDQTAVATRV
jgi:hypothetical protein